MLHWSSLIAQHDTQYANTHYATFNKEIDVLGVDIVKTALGAMR